MNFLNLACLDDPGLGLAVAPSVQSSYRDENWLQIGDAEPWNYTITRLVSFSISSSHLGTRLFGADWHT